MFNLIIINAAAFQIEATYVGMYQSDSNGILLPIMRGKCLERHHICDAIMNAISFNQIKFELTRLIQIL